MSRVTWRFSAEVFLAKLRPDICDPYQPLTFLAVRCLPFEGNLIEVLVEDPFRVDGAREGDEAPVVSSEMEKT